MDRMTAAEYRAAVVYDRRKRKKAHKYNAVRAYRCAACGLAVMAANSACPACHKVAILSFDSRAEAGRYDLLRQMQKLGLISNLRRQVPFEITVEGEGIATYYADFAYRDENGVEHIEDVKGMDTAVSRLKRKLVEAQHGIKIEIVK